MSKNKKITEPVASMTRDAIHFTSDNLLSELSRKNISASLITGLSNCEAQWAAGTFVLPKFLDEHPDNPKTRGSLFHKVMEDFFALEQRDRTHEAMRNIVDDVLSSEEFSDMAEFPEVVEWLRDAVNGYFSMGAEPKKVKIAEIPKHNSDETTRGLEVFVKGKIGNASRDTLGYIDRLIVDPRKSAPSDGIVIEDWKTSQKAKNWKSNRRNPIKDSTEGLAEARQQMIYSILLKNMGLNPTAARLLYPIPEEIVSIDIEDEELRSRVVSDVEETDRHLDKLLDTNTFEYSPSFLCAWCPLAKVCPVATIKPYKKMQDAVEKQPEQDELSTGFDIQF